MIGMMESVKTSLSDKYFLETSTKQDNAGHAAYNRKSFRFESASQIQKVGLQPDHLLLRPSPQFFGMNKCLIDVVEVIDIMKCFHKIKLEDKVANYGERHAQILETRLRTSLDLKKKVDDKWGKSSLTRIAESQPPFIHY